MFSSQQSLFGTPDEKAPIEYFPNFFKDFCRDSATEVLEHSKTLKWRHNSLRTTPLPRMETLYGDPNIHYCYASVTLHSNGWDVYLKRLRDILQEVSGYKFNYAIGNLYRDHNDSIGWHDDSKPELGNSPAIASVSLGAARKFQFRKKPSGSIETITLAHGSLLLMYPGFQEEWLHRIDKEKQAKDVRINWTFRNNIK